MRRVWNDPGNKGHRIRRLGIYLWARTMNRLGRSVVVPFGLHSRIEVSPEASSAAIVARSPIPDWPEMQAWRQLLTPGDVFVDVGAHLGTYSLWAGEQGARVIAVEPNPPVAIMLRCNLALNQVDARVYEVAVADAPGVMKMAGPDQARMALTSSGDVDVIVTTLDALVGDVDVAGVKVDVEGAELLVLRGARNLLGRVPVWQLEWNRLADRDPVARFLHDRGFELTRPDSGGVLRPCAGDVGRDVFAVLGERLDGG